MFGMKPKTYQEIRRMKICQWLQIEIPNINEELLKKIYDSMTNNVGLPIYIHNGFVRFGDGEEDEAFAIHMDSDKSSSYRIANGMLYYLKPNSRNSADGGVGGNNNNNNNNNNA